MNPSLLTLTTPGNPTATTALRAALVVVISLAFVATTLAAGPAAAADEEIKVRIGSVAPTGTPWSALLSRQKKRLLKAADEKGLKLKFKLYLGGKLGSEQSLVRRCQRGQLAAIAVSNGAIGQAVPEMYATELPYLFDNFKQVDKAFGSAPVRELMDRKLAEKGFLLWMIGENGFRHFASKEKFFGVPGDLRGMKMRAQPAMPHVEMYNALGASASTIPVGEVTSSLANGVVSGYDNTLLYAFATQWHKEVKYITKSAHIYQAAVVVWCKPWFDAQPEAVRNLIRHVPAGEEKKGRAAVRAMNKVLEKQYANSGVQIKELSAAAKAKFKAATSGVEKKFLGKASADGKKLLELLKANR